jgi:PHP family Zn ribbon phosphoesterase
MRDRTPCSDCAFTYKLDPNRDDYKCDACDDQEDEDARVDELKETYRRFHEKQKGSVKSNEVSTV